jgi:hypothetical protein
MSNTKSTFILFGEAGQNVAQGDPKFGKRLRKAFACEWTTKDIVSAMLMRYAFDESDNYIFTEDRNEIIDIYGNSIIKRGEMQYDHDSRTWSFVELDELDESDAEIVLMDNVLFDESDKSIIYNMHENLRPIISIEPYR